MSRQEFYELTWPGKREAIIEAGRPTDKTLRPCVSESKNFDETQNLYIEGDNLEALKLLQKSYMKRVKMIYIDPPYNTGHDFIYRDDFSQSELESQTDFDLFDDDGTKNFSFRNYRENTRTNPRFHSDWLSMIYPRLKLARNLLADDGVIFISIDDNEQANLRKICDEIFGESNFVALVTWFKKSSPSNDAQFFSNDCEYILVYAANKEIWRPHRLPLSDEQIAQYYKNPDNDPRGVWNSATYTCNKTRRERPNLYYPITNPFTGEEVFPKETAVWAYSEEQYREHVKNNLLYWGADGKAKFPRFKKFISENRGVVTRTLWHYDEVNHTQGATLELAKMGLQYFSNPKPSRLIEKMLKIATDNDSLILDFFSGSSTTAHAVMQLNHEDGGSRKFIMIQIPEECNESSEAFKAGFHNICDIGKERIRRAGESLTGDTGFRVMKVNSSNYRDVFFTPESLSQDMLDDMIENIKSDRSGLDLLFGTIAELGLTLSQKFSCEEFAGFEIFYYGENEIIACFDSGINEELVTFIAKKQPKVALFRDSCFEDSNVMINLEQFFTFYAPESEIKIL